MPRNRLVGSECRWQRRRSRNHKKKVGIGSQNEGLGTRRLLSDAEFDGLGFPCHLVWSALELH